LFGEEGMAVINALQLTDPGANYFIDTYSKQNTNKESESVEDGNGDGPAPLRLLCMSFTYEPRHSSVRAAMLTWARDCDGYLAASNSTSDSSLPTVTLQDGGAGGEVGESYETMSVKSRLIWTMVAQSQLIDEFDYFLLSGDDVYVLVDNLKAYLRYIEQTTSGRNSEGKSGGKKEKGGVPIFVGRKMHQNALLQFYHGGSGYVMNRAAVAALHYLFATQPEACLTRAYTSMEDVMTARCLMHAGVSTFDAKDPVSGRHIFHPHRPGEAYLPKNGEFVQQVHSYRSGEDCCSTHSVSFQDFMPVQMHCLHHRLQQMKTRQQQQKEK
jgi:hypothetical protein